MDYELFKEVVAEKIISFMPEKFKDFKAEVSIVSKVNGKKEALNLVPMGADALNTSPSVYFEDMYAHYEQCEDLQEVLEQISEKITDMFEKAPQSMPELSYDTAKENIVFQLVNTEQNKEMLTQVPHREFQDLSIIYRWVVKQEAEGITSTMINHGLAENLKMDENDLFALATINTKRLFPPLVRSMEEIMRDIFVGNGMPENMIGQMMEDVPEEKKMYVISNQRNINGATSILYEECLHNLAEQMSADLYIMPSSLHEMIAVSVDSVDPNELAEMVADVNMNQVSIEERLSNQVYHYDKDLRKLSLATDTPNKRLDRAVMEKEIMKEVKSQSR